jgi:hypothetical protein
VATRKRTTRLTREQAESYMVRWEPVRLIELEELRATPPAEKFRQLAGLVAFGRTLGWILPDRSDDQEVRDRWQQLRRAYGVDR